jgi:glycosyltransferase involved in cell wall biosynthesis
MGSEIPKTSVIESPCEEPIVAQPRIAVVCDFAEEGWPSMDLVGDMLCQNLSSEFGSQLRVVQVRPALCRRFSRLPVLRGKLAWNTDRLINRMFDYPRWIRDRAGDFELFHVIDHSYSQVITALPPGRGIVTCHDLDTFRCILEPERDPRPSWFRAMANRIMDGFRRAAHVVAVSHATRDELLHHGLFPPERITVVPNGVHPSCTTFSDPPADAAVDQFLAKLGHAQLLLSVGSTLPRKRLDVLLHAFAGIHTQLPEVRLVRVGGLTPSHLQLAEKLNISSSILILPYLHRPELAALYRRCSLLLHTADAEGFGLPLLEAMACGCPVVASDIPVLREVGGHGAEFCPVGNIGSWVQTVVHLLGEKRLNSDRWAVRRENGLSQAGKFSWAENARRCERIYRKTLADRF